MIDPSADPLVGRETDPETSTAGVKRTRTLKHMVFIAAAGLGGEFTDTELRKQIKWEFFEDVDRGVVARTRLTLERDGKLRRLPLTDDDKELRFTLTLGGVMTAKGSRI